MCLETKNKTREVIMKRFIAFLMLLAMLTGVLSACGGDSTGSTTTTNPPAASFMVSLDADANILIDGDSEILVAAGEAAEFTISVDKGYYVNYISTGTYDPATGKVRLENVQEDTVITITTAVDTGVTVSITGEHFTASPSSKDVKRGEDAEFVLNVENGYVVVSVDICHIRN